MSEPGLCGCGVADDDVDGDGVPDCRDQCPNSPVGVDIDAHGCPDVGACCFFSGACFDDADHSACDAVGARYQGQDSVRASGCSLGDGDVDGSLLVDLSDFSYWPQCATDPRAGAIPGGCESLDFVDPSAIDLWDFAYLQRMLGLCYDPLDTDEDAIPDACDACPFDSDNDFDSDGVCGDVDECLGTPPGEPVNAFGCAPSEIDSDGDGVSDSDDNCPDTPAGAVDVDLNGCILSQRDTDGDGVNDAVDQCPNTPFNETPNAVGCSASQIDTDFDGVSDNADNCVTTTWKRSPKFEPDVHRKESHLVGKCNAS